MVRASWTEKFIYIEFIYEQFRMKCDDTEKGNPVYGDQLQRGAQS